MRFTSHLGLGDLTHVRRYSGAQSAGANALQHPSDRQHPGGRGLHQHDPADQQESLEDHHAAPATAQAGHVAGRQRAERSADAEHRAERLRVPAGHRERHLAAGLQHELRGRRPAEYRSVGYRSQRRCNGARRGGRRVRPRLNSHIFRYRRRERGELGGAQPPLSALQSTSSAFKRKNTRSSLFRRG